MCCAEFEFDDRLTESSRASKGSFHLTRDRRSLNFQPFINYKLLRIRKNDKGSQRSRKKSGKGVKSRRVKKREVKPDEEEESGILRAISVLKDSLDNIKQRGSPNNVLDQLESEVEALKTGRLKNQSHVAECVIKGNWASEIAGGTFHLKDHTFNNRKREPIRHTKISELHQKGFMSTSEWNCSVLIPYEHNSQYLILSAYNVEDKLIATFMGECKLCRKHTIIQGNWLMGRHSRDCESRAAANQLIGDVWRSDKLDDLSEKLRDHLTVLNKHTKKVAKTTEGPVAALSATVKAEEEKKSKEPKEKSAKKGFHKKILNIFRKKPKE